MLKFKRDKLSEKLQSYEADYQDHIDILEFYHKNNDMALAHYRRTVLAKTLLAWYTAVPKSTTPAVIIFWETPT